MKSVISKQSLYYFDSSDDENEDKLTNAKYTLKNISNTLAKIEPYLEASYTLTEVSYSILEQQAIQEKYTKLKNDLSKKLKIPENVNFYNKVNKFLGKFLVEGIFTSKINLDKEAETFVKKIWNTGNEAKIFLQNSDFFNKHVGKLFQDIVAISNDQRNLQNKCLEVCAGLLGVLDINNKNVNALTKEIIKSYNNKSSLLSVILSELKEKNIVNFQKYEEKLKLLEGKTVQDFAQKVIIGVNLDSVRKSHDIIIKEARFFKLKEDKDDYANIIFLKKEQKINQQQKLLDQYNEFIVQYFSKEYIELCYSIDEEGNKYVDKNKFSLFISCVLDDHEGITKNTNIVLAQYFSEQNQSIVNELIAYREMYLLVFDLGEDYFAGFKLDHRIIKAKLKTNAILEKQETIYSARTIKNTTINVQTKLTINSSGTREDYKFLPNDQSSYKSVAMELSKFNKISFRDNLKNILCGKLLNDCNLSQQLYLYRLADLLFNCEGERNISAFLTNIMFFELIEQGICKIQDLPNVLPMAMKGAIQASRYTLDMLGGKYGEEHSKNYLIKRQHFDYKTTSYKNQVSSKMQIEKATQTQQELKEILLHYELALKNIVILSDWINKKHDSSTDALILLINTINGIYDANTKEFNGHNVTYIEQKNKICMSELKKFFLLEKEKLDLEDSFKEKLIQSIKILTETPKEAINLSELQNLAKDITLYIADIEKLEEQIKSNLNIFSTKEKTIMLIEKCMKMVDGYSDISNNLHPKLSEESLITTRKLKKAIIHNIKQEEINDFEKLIEYSAQLKDKLPNFALMLLESVKNGINQYISTLPRLKIDETVFKSLQTLINSWYNIDLSYLSQELKGLEISSKAKNIDWIDYYFSVYSLDALNKILDLRLKDLKLNDISTFKSFLIDYEHNNIIELLFYVTNIRSKITLSPLSLFNKHAG